MPTCREFLRLQEQAGIAVSAYRTLTAEHWRVRAITGFSERQLRETVIRADEARQAACTALLEHIAAHGCSSGNCQLSGQECSFCDQPGRYRAAS